MVDSKSKGPHDNTDESVGELPNSGLDPCAQTVWMTNDLAAAGSPELFMGHCC